MTKGQAEGRAGVRTEPVHQHPAPVVAGLGDKIWSKYYLQVHPLTGGLHLFVVKITLFPTSNHNTPF